MLRKLDIAKNLHVLVIEDKEKKIFLAHCLDMDIVGEGKDDREAVSNLIELINVQVNFCLSNDTLYTLFRSAPKECWDMLYSSQAAKIINQLSLRRKNSIKKLTSHIEIAYA